MQFRLNQHAYDLPSQEQARGLLIGLGFETTAAEFADPFGYRPG